jgi:hypothetical protein
MPFSPSPETLAAWKKSNPRPASDAEIAALEQRLGGKAPPSYVEFMKRYGNVEFSDEIECRFEYVYQKRDRSERRSKAVSFIKSPDKALQYYDGLQKDPDVRVPSHLLPFAMDYGQGELLIEFGQPTERIFYLDFDPPPSDGEETLLGFVANDMHDFINNLKPFDS